MSRIAAPEGDRVDASVARAAESLLRSLVGVSAATVNADRRGRVAGIVVTPAPGVGGRQLARNVASALMARFGMVVDPAAIIIGSPSAETSSWAVDPPAVAPDDPTRPVSERAAGSTVANRSGHTDEQPAETRQHAGTETLGPWAGAGPLSASAAESAPPVAGPSPEWASVPDPVARAGHADPDQARIEIVELSPVGSGLRCRVVVGVGEELFTGIGDAGLEPHAEAEVGARVTLDALRAARIPRDPVQFDGVTIVRVGGQPHAVTALSFWTGSDFARRSGAEPVAASMAEAAARSVFRTVMWHLGEQSGNRTAAAAANHR